MRKGEGVNMNITETTSKEIYDTLSAVYQIVEGEEVEIWGGSSAEEERMLRQVLKALEKARAEISYFRATQNWGE
jgi:hypothetical protein